MNVGNLAIVYAKSVTNNFVYAHKSPNDHSYNMM